MTQQHLTPLRLLFILLLVASGVLGAGKLGAQSEGVSVSYSLESSATTMHEPIIVRFEVYNGSKEPMTVQLGADRTEGFAIQVKWPDGSAHKRPPAPVREGIRRTGNVSLAPGEHLRHELLLNEWASFSTPGKYELDVRLLTPIETAGGKFVSEPYHASFRVLPRDESQLKATCERLVRQIEDAAQVLITVVKESPAWPPNTATSAGTRAILAQRALHTIAATTSHERLKQDISRSVPK